MFGGSGRTGQAGVHKVGTNRGGMPNNVKLTGKTITLTTKEHDNVEALPSYKHLLEGCLQIGACASWFVSPSAPPQQRGIGNTSY